jgi:fatty acid desaturase
MPAVKAANPKLIFARDDWARLTGISQYRGIWLVVHCWAMIIGVTALATYWGNLLGWIAAIIIIAGRQLGLAILMHDAAHGHLHPVRRVNNILGQWLTGAAIGSDLFAYRSYHLMHHRFTQQLEDPDLALSAHFPATPMSMARKITRDLLGIVFIKQRSAQAAMAVRSISPAAKGQNVFIGKSFLRFLGMQALLLGLSLTLYGWTPFILWIVALATSFQLFLRIRNIAEHACTTTGSDDPFSHARTTRANWIERITVAPYWVNFHSEHHLFMGVPCYNLPRAHNLLGQNGHHAKMTIASGYVAVMRVVVAGR